jgi:protein-S-isoprenylcysteine O-methyltransferase Ste14
MHRLELKIPPVVGVFIFAALMGFTARHAPAFNWRIPGRPGLSAFVAFTGLAIGAAAAFLCRRARTTLDPTRPAAASALITSGVFGRSRNPIYVGMLLLLLAWALHIGNLLAFLFLPGFVLYMNRFQIIPEEKFLLSRFGDAFSAYQSRVRRWL